MLLVDVREPIKERVPVSYPGQGVKSAAAMKNPGTLITGPGKPSSLPGSWPQFRGARRDNIARDSKPIPRSWPKDGPAVLWRLPVGEGHAGATIHNGRVYLIDYDRAKQEDAIRCLSLDDAKEIWRYTYSVEIKRYHGMSRTVMAVNDKFAVALGPMCQFSCLDAVTGQLIWKIDLVEEYGVIIPPWYAGQCPLIEETRVILAPSSAPLMMALDLATSRTLWRTPPEADNAGMTHSSIAAMTFNGQKQYIYCSGIGVFGVADGDGRILWKKKDWKIGMANIPSPVVVGEDRVFLTGGYGSGCVMIRLKAVADGKIETEEVFRAKPELFGSDQQTPILYENHIYGVSADKNLVCLDLSGKRKWNTSEGKFGLGPYLIADGVILALEDEKGTLVMSEATPQSYKELARAKLLKGINAWAPMAMAEGRLILRDLTEMICVDLNAK